MSNDFSHDQAIVIGGGIAGLLAARVLADHFSRVILIERDRYPDIPSPRSGVPQGHHVHSLLPKGYQILAQLFPDLITALLDKGALSIDWSEDFAWLTSVSNVWAPRFSSGLITCLCSRSLLESTLRQQLKNFSQIHLLEKTRVTELCINYDRTLVKGIKAVEGTKTQPSQLLELPAQLVVDASGRHSQTPQWLTALGYPMPQETRIDSFLGYASRLYQLPHPQPPDWKLLYLMPSAPDHPRGAMIFPIQGNRWIATLLGMGKDYPPSEDSQFLAFAQSLRHEVVYQTLLKAQPLSPIYSYRNTANRLRHYEKLANMPDNFIVLGDAVCTLTPVYAQGMTVAALHALTLKHFLKQKNSRQRHFHLASQPFQQQIAQVNRIPWTLSTSADLRWPTTVGAKPGPIQKLIQLYLDQIMKAAVEDNILHQTLLEVMSMLISPTVLFKPHILFKVMQRRFAISHQLLNKTEKI